MKILLDNCVAYRVKGILAGHEVLHAKDMGWEKLNNGRLLASAAQSGFAVMITVDKRIKYEQNLNRMLVSVIEIDIPDSRFPAIAAIASHLHRGLKLVNQFRFISIDPDGRLSTAAERA